MGIEVQQKDMQNCIQVPTLVYKLRTLKIQSHFHFMFKYTNLIWWIHILPEGC